MTQKGVVIRLSEDIEAHIFFGLGGGLFLCFFLGLFGSTTGGSGSTSNGGTGTNTRADVGDQLGDVTVLEGTGEKSGPEWLNIDVGGLESRLRYGLEDG